MKQLALVFAILCLALAQAKEIKKERVTIKTESQAGFEGLLADIYAGIEYAFETGSGDQGRMQALDYYLLYVGVTTQGKSWICMEGADGLSHISYLKYGYFKVTDGLIGHSIKVICGDC